LQQQAPSLVKAAQDLLFPPVCLGCRQPLDTSRPPLLCAECSGNLDFIRSPHCLCCGLPFISGADHLCGDCLAGHLAFDLSRSLLAYRPPASELIRSLKFSGNLNGIATFHALIMREDLLNVFAEPDIVVPVPLHIQRLRERGFNQALVIAKGCLPGWRKKITTGLLLRHSPTIPQSQLSGKDRRTNLKNVFSLADTGQIAGAKVLLIDDVYTTGSTVNECSKALRRAGAKRIEVFTLARSLAW
jgi:ComF family protein